MQVHLISNGGGTEGAHLAVTNTSIILGVNMLTRETTHNRLSICRSGWLGRVLTTQLTERTAH